LLSTILEDFSWVFETFSGKLDETEHRESANEV
jgi:hypothetical protein